MVINVGIISILWSRSIDFSKAWGSIYMDGRFSVTWSTLRSICVSIYWLEFIPFLRTCNPCSTILTCGWRIAQIAWRSWWSWELLLVILTITLIQSFLLRSRSWEPLWVNLITTLIQHFLWWSGVYCWSCVCLIAILITLIQYLLWRSWGLLRSIASQGAVIWIFSVLITVINNRNDLWNWELLKYSLLWSDLCTEFVNIRLITLRSDVSCSLWRWARLVLIW